MARHPEPWYRAFNDAWYVKLDGKQHRLAKGKGDKKAALEAFHRLMAGQGEGKATGPGPGPTVHTINRLFLDHVEVERKPLTYQWYLRHLGKFGKAHGDRLASEIRPHHVADWAGSKGWGPSTRAGAITAVKAMFAWARKMGHLETDPVKDLPKPRARRREKVLSGESADAILAATEGKGFGELLLFLRESGARPSEAAALTAADIDPTKGLAILNEHKTDGTTTKPRVIVLNAAALALVIRLAARHPEGAIFRNARGNPWTRWAMSNAWRRLRPKLGIGHEATAQAMRHRFATDLAREHPNTIVAALLGHSGTAMVDRVYSHVKDEIAGEGLEQLRKAVERKRRGG